MRRIIFGVVIFLTWMTLPAYAATLKKLSELNIDTSIISEQSSYTTPDSIIIAPLFAPTELNIDPIERYRGVFHYIINRLGYNDVPFHYIITPEGEVIEGNIHGDESKVLIENFNKKPVVIAYMADPFSNHFDERAIDDIKELASSVANTNSIKETNIFVKELIFTRNRESRVVNIKIKDLYGTWNSQTEDIKNFVAANFSPQSKPYTLEVISVNIPNKTLSPGNIEKVSITLKNIGEYGLYAFTNSELYLSKADGTSSKFFVNNEWESRSQVSLFEQEDSLAPGEEKSFEIPIYIPLFLGEQKETFNLKTALGSLVNSSEIEIKINVGESEKKIVEIKNRGYSYYPVYSSPTNSSSEIYRAVAGERFFFLQDVGNGWYQIDLGNGITGWIAYWNVSFIN
jgi:hypothetical protein